MGMVDLHFHTFNSDGAFTTAAILKMCEENDLKIISITDHDSMQSYFDIKNQNLDFNGKIIAGVELSFKKEGRLFDVLGYGVDVEYINSWIKERYKKEALIKNQESILEEMKKLYTKLGIKFDTNLKVAIGKKSEAYNLIKNSALQYEENRAVAPELFGDMFYKKYHTNSQSKYFVDETKMLPSLTECLKVIHDAGGISSLAHSGAYGFTKEEMRKFIEYAINCGVKGLELKYNCHTEDDERLIKTLAERSNLYLTGGSDFHGGKVKPNVKIGKIYNQKNIYENDMSKFLNVIKYFK